jgi:predicted metal-binding membrane protein
MAATTQPDRAFTTLGSVVKSDRLRTMVPLIVVPLVAWAWIVVLARDLSGSTIGASAWMMTPSWDAGHLALLWVMWAVMMTGMMLPSATPMLMLYETLICEYVDAPVQRTYALALGYLAAWALFSLGITALQHLLASHLLLSPMLQFTSRGMSAALLVAAGVYQFTPLKAACLRECQSPWGFLLTRGRDGATGALVMGLEHGAYCVGCCWVMMLLLFAGGVMNLAVIAALTALVALEKLVPIGARGAHVSGMLLIAAGAWMLVR